MIKLIRGSLLQKENKNITIIIYTINEGTTSHTHENILGIIELLKVLYIHTYVQDTYNFS